MSTMPDLAQIAQSASSHAWLYLPFAVLLGALHALEPGHAKSLMAAYIVAIRGTAGQAVTLAGAAAVGHTIVVWALAVAALSLGERYVVDEAEPWLTLLSGILVVLLALRMFWVLRRRGHDRHGHSHHPGPLHHHSRSRPSDHLHHCGPLHDGRTEGDHDRHARPAAPNTGVTTGQIVWFGFTGGLLPCPGAIAVLLVCIQLKAFALGLAMVAAFSAGLALTLVAIGVAVAWSSARLAGAWPGLDRWAGRLPYLSAAVVLAMGLALSAAGLSGTGLIGPKRPR